MKRCHRHRILDWHGSLVLEQLESRHLLTSSASTFINVIESSASSIVVQFETPNFNPQPWAPGGHPADRALQDRVSLADLRPE